MGSLGAVGSLFDWTARNDELLTSFLLASVMVRSTFIDDVLLVGGGAHISAHLMVVGAHHVLSVGFDLQVFHIVALVREGTVVQTSVSLGALLSWVLILGAEWRFLAHARRLTRLDESVNGSVLVVVMAFPAVVGIVHFPLYNGSNISDL